jgi:tetratricopeptide (TPR) repeat protein
MGVVYRARDLALDREVAVKVLLQRYELGSSTAARFVEEARITAQLQHPGIPAVYQVGALPDSRPFLAMKLIKGQTLDSLLKAKAPIDRLAVFEAVAQAVGYAHAHGVLHRDLKPANVMVGSFGEVQVMDWGLAKVLGSRATARPAGPSDPEATTDQTAIGAQRDHDTPFTQYGSLLGTPAYLAPEQAAGELEKIDCRSDVFGLGAILCVLLTGQPPYTGKDAESIRIAAVRGKTEEALTRLDTCGADPDVIALCKQCLVFDPAGRPASANEVAAAVAALRQAADERARQAEHDRRAAEVRAAEQAKRRRLTLWAAGAVAAVLLVGVAGTTWGLLWAESKRQEAEGERDAKEQARLAEEAAHTTAEGKRKEAERARAVATEQRRLALATVRDILLQVDELMKKDVRLAPLRIAMNQRMLKSVDRIRDHALKNPLEDRTEALAYSHLGDIYFRANRIKDSRIWYAKAYAVLDKSAKDNPDDPTALRNLAVAATQLAEPEWRLGHGARSRELHTIALELRRRRLKITETSNVPRKELEVVSARLDIAQSLAAVAYKDLLSGDPVSAIRHYTASETAYAALPPRIAKLLSVRRNRPEIKVRLADAHARLGKLDESEQLFRAALADRETLVKANPGPPNIVLLKTDVGQSRMYLGDFLKSYRKDRAAALVEYLACRDLFSAMLKEEPDNLDLRQRLGATHIRLAGLYTDPEKARAAYTDCLKLYRELAAIDPRDTLAGVQLAGALAQAGETVEAEKVIAKLLKQAGTDRFVLRYVASALSSVAGKTADKEAATRCRDQAIQVLRDLVKAGWKDRAALESGFEPIRDDPRFQKLLKELASPKEVEQRKGSGQR